MSRGCSVAGVGTRSARSLPLRRLERMCIAAQAMGVRLTGVLVLRAAAGIEGMRVDEVVLTSPCGLYQVFLRFTRCVIFPIAAAL